MKPSSKHCLTNASADPTSPMGLSGFECLDLSVVAGLNNAGVQFLARRDLDSASRLFRSALRFFIMDTLSLADATCILDTANTALLKSPHKIQDEDSLLSSNAPAHIFLPFVHDEGMTIHPSNVAYASDPLANVTVISSIVVFNLAVVYHVQALRESCLSHQNLSRAHSLYLKTLKLLSDARVDTNKTTDNVTLDLLIMSLCNNLAQATHHVGAYQDSHLCFEQLIRFGKTIDCTNAEDNVVSWLQLKLSVFLLNAMVLREPTVAASA